MKMIKIPKELHERKPSTFFSFPSILYRPEFNLSYVLLICWHIFRTENVQMLAKYPKNINSINFLTRNNIDTKKFRSSAIYYNLTEKLFELVLENNNKYFSIRFVTDTNYLNIIKASETDFFVLNSGHPYISIESFYKKDDDNIENVEEEEPKRIYVFVDLYLSDDVDENDYLEVEDISDEITIDSNFLL